MTKVLKDKPNETLPKAAQPGSKSETAQQPASGKSKYSLAADPQDLLFLSEVKPRLNPEALAAT